MPAYQSIIVLPLHEKPLGPPRILKGSLLAYNDHDAAAWGSRFQVGQAPRGSFAAWEVTFKSGNLTRRQQAVLRLGTVGDLRSGRVRESEGGGEEAEIAQL